MAWVNSDSLLMLLGLEFACEKCASLGNAVCSGESWSSGGSSASAAKSSSPIGTVGAVEMLNILSKLCMAEPLLAASACCFWWCAMTETLETMNYVSGESNVVGPEDR